MTSLSSVPSSANAPPGQGAATRTRDLLLHVTFAVLALIAIYPVLSVDVPPIVDYPNHLARMHILSTWESDPDLQKNYAVEWSLGPNMAIDLVLPLLTKVFSLYDAGRVFVVTTLLLIVGGTLTLRKVVVGKVGLWPMLAFLLLYNHAFFWGFLGFLFTAGLALFAFSAWIALREHPNSLRFAVFAVVSVLLFYGHLFGLLIYGILVVGFEVGWTWRNRRMRPFPFSAYVVSGGQFLLPFLLFLAWVGSNESTSDAINRFGTLAAKVVALISPVHFGLPAIDIPTAIFLGGVLILCMTRRWVWITESLRLPLLLLTVVAALMPNFLSGVWGTDFRLPAIVGCVLVASVRTKPTALRQARLIIAVAVVLLVGRTAMIAEHWRDLDTKFEEFRTASHVMQRGSRLLVVADKNDVPEGTPPLYEMKFWHLGALAVIERGSFYPTLFTGHTTVNASPATALIDSPVGTPVTRKVLAANADPSKSPYPLNHRLSRYIWLYWIGWPAHFDYVLSIRHANTANPFPSRLERVHEGSYFDIYRVMRP